ncbi:hypothetical protein QR680_010473 [Steinernema hermaphroditum]|uniref:Uncharacterized protein n=1 Tax=Steinernema hermaphroditum TaxID=289476 RepID=A0AA39IP46_9BILA|nr:hypothetical protein QR680_010473 [Steinernema hermaphroditum]
MPSSTLIPIYYIKHIRRPARTGSMNSVPADFMERVLRYLADWRINTVKLLSGNFGYFAENDLQKTFDICFVFTERTFNERLPYVRSTVRSLESVRDNDRKSLDELCYAKKNLKDARRVRIYIDEFISLEFNADAAPKAISLFEKHFVSSADVPELKAGPATPSIMKMFQVNNNKRGAIRVHNFLEPLLGTETAVFTVSAPDRELVSLVQKRWLEQSARLHGRTMLYLAFQMLRENGSRNVLDDSFWQAAMAGKNPQCKYSEHENLEDIRTMPERMRTDVDDLWFGCAEEADGYTVLFFECEHPTRPRNRMYLCVLRYWWNHIVDPLYFHNYCLYFE